MNDKLARVEPQYIERDPMRDWEVMRLQAEALVKSRLLPRAVDTPEKAIAIIQTGRELGVGPMQALRSIHVIEGKPTMSAELMAGLVFARVPGAVLRVKFTSNEECIVEAARPGQPLTTFSFTMADARAAGLTGKDNWKKYPAPMLRARALAGASRAIAPDATMGMLTPDELGAVTTETGEIVTTYEPVESGPHSPHDDGLPPSDTLDPDMAANLLERMANAKSMLATCDSYDKALAIRALIGSAAKQSQLTKDVQFAKESRLITPEQHRELSKIWQHVHRQVTKLEAQLAPSAEEIFHEPEPEADPDNDGR